MSVEINGYDWSDLKHTWELQFLQLAPSNATDVLGELEGVDLSSASITEGYYTDTRVQAKLDYYDASRYRQAFIQVRASVPEWGYSTILGTFMPTDDDVSLSGGSVKTSLSLESMLYAMDLQQHSAPWVVYQGASLQDVVDRISINTCRPWRNCSMNGYNYGSTVVYGSGESYLSCLFDACNQSNNRVDVEGDGTFTISPYILPNRRTPVFTLDVTDERGIVSDGITRSSDYLSLPTECSVYYNANSENKTDVIYGYASHGGRFGHGERGYIISKVESVSEAPAGGVAELNEKAQTLLANASTENVEWELTTEYMPVHAGDVGYIRGLTQDIEPYNGQQLVMIKNIELELEHMTMKLTLKSSNSLDEE